MKIKLSKSQWELIGRKAGWAKKASSLIWDLKKDSIKVTDQQLYDLIEKIKDHFCGKNVEGCSFLTKDLALFLGISTSKAYNICKKLESELGIICKYGYEVKDNKGNIIGFDSPEESTRHPQSLRWQFNVHYGKPDAF